MAPPLAWETTVPAILAQRAQDSPAATAWVADGGGALTFAELDGRANHVAQTLIGAGLQPAALVAVRAQRCLSTVIATFGILRACAAYLPLAAHEPAERAAYQLADSGCTWLVGGDGSHEADCGVDNHWDLEQLVDGVQPTAPKRRVTHTDAAYAIYTSGSSGRPKGVVIEHGALCNRLQWIARHYAVGAGDVLLQKTPLTFDVSVQELFLGAFTGARTVAPKAGAEANPRALAAVIEKHGVTIVHFVPSMLQVLLANLETDELAQLRSVRLLLCSGEVLSPQLAERAARAMPGAQIANLYGPTEATIDVTYFDCPPEPETVPIGQPIDGARVWIRDGDREVAVGERGELCLGGVVLGRGYLGAARDDPAFTTHPATGERIYRTGDLVSVDSDGLLHFHGRIDRQLKVRGVRIEPGEIEAALRACPGIQECAVVGQRGADGLVRLVAFVVEDEGFDPQRARSGLRQRLPEAMVPSAMVPIDQLPRTAHGKVDYEALRRR